MIAPDRGNSSSSASLRFLERHAPAASQLLLRAQILMAVTRAERLHVETGERVVGHHVEAAPRRKPFQSLARAEHGERAVQAPRVEKIGRSVVP